MYANEVNEKTNFIKDVFFVANMITNTPKQLFILTQYAVYYTV